MDLERSFKYHIEWSEALIATGSGVVMGTAAGLFIGMGIPALTAIVIGVEGAALGLYGADRVIGKEYTKWLEHKRS